MGCAHQDREGEGQEQEEEMLARHATNIRCGCRQMHARRCDRYFCSMRRAIILAGIGLLLVGLLWPWLVKSGIWRWFGRLPGDIRIEREGFSLYFPIVTMLLLSALLSLVLWLFRR
jgi:hypothetical protein